MVRFKNRYIFGELNWSEGRRDGNFANNDLMRHVKQSVQSSFGEYGFAQVVSSLQVKYWNATTNCYILRVAREYVQLLWSALILITRIDGRAVVFRVMHVSGTMKNVQDKAARLLTEAQRQQQQL